jgi:hypothetical protein
MRISKNSKIGVALSVLRKINIKSADVMVNTYSNCREQGFFVISYLGNVGADINGRRAVSFAENRNSDDIIVQYGVWGDFDDYGVFKSEDKYNRCKKYFKYGDSEGAAKFITEWLKG